MEEAGQVRSIMTRVRGGRTGKEHCEPGMEHHVPGVEQAGLGRGSTVSLASCLAEKGPRQVI